MYDFCGILSSSSQVPAPVGLLFQWFSYGICIWQASLLFARFWCSWTSSPPPAGGSVPCCSPSHSVCYLRDSGVPGPPLLLPQVALFLAAPPAILYAICAILVLLDLLSSSRGWLCSLLLPQPFCTLFARFWCLRWPLETHFELFWVLVTKWLSDGLWRLILSYSEVWWPNGSQLLYEPTVP